jgi:hypothetical protein
LARRGLEVRWELGRNHEQRLIIGAAEGAGEAAAIELDRLQNLAAFADAHATEVRDVRVPHGPFGVEADAVGWDSVAKLRPDSPAREGAVGGDVERGQLVGVGLGQNQRELSGVTTIPLGNATPSATSLAAPSDVTKAIVPGANSPPGNSKPRFPT